MSVFSTDQTFKSRNDMMEWVQNTARALGHVIVTKRSKTKPNGYSKVTLICERGGVYRSVKGTSKATGTKKINCPFELMGIHTKENDCWKLRVIRGEHNHLPAQHMEGHAFVERLSHNEFQLVADLTKKHVAPRDILGIIKEQNEDNVSTLKTIYNARNKIQKTNRKGKTPMQVVLSHLHENDYVFYTSINNASNELESLFFIHKTSFDLVRVFPHVMLMDATYRTNKYDIPFLQIVGVTSTNKTFSIAFAFMHKETTEMYIWVLKCLKLILLEKLKGIIDPSISTLEEPKVRKNTRGRPSLKKKQQQQSQAEPQYSRKRSRTTTSNVVEYNFMDLKPSPPRHSSHANDSELLMKEPSVQKKTHRRPSVKKQQIQQSRADSQYPHKGSSSNTSNVVEYNFMDLNASTPILSKSLMKQIPDMFHPYISRIKDVDGDGNCGFRSVAVGLELDENYWGFIRSELVQEMDVHQEIWRKIFDTIVKGEYDHLRRNIDYQGEGNTTSDHWMEMPHTGLLIAQRFGVIVHLLSIDCNQTFFPLLIGPNQTRVPHQVVSLVHVNKYHFIHVRLQGDYPMPLPNSLWSKNRSDVAADWEVMYRSRMAWYKELRNPKQDRTVQDID